MKKKSPIITLDDWLIELSKHQEGEAGATVSELAKKMKMSPTLIRRKLRGLIDDGRVVVGKSFRAAIDGRQTIVPVYRMTKPK